MTLEFHVSPLGRCVFALCEIIDGVRLTCIIFAYVDDLVVVGSSVLTARIIEGGNDYLGLEIDASPGDIHVHQGNYVKKVVDTNGYGDCKPAHTPRITDFTVADRVAPAGTDAAAAARLDFREIVLGLDPPELLNPREYRYLMDVACFYSRQHQFRISTVQDAGPQPSGVS